MFKKIILSIFFIILTLLFTLPLFLRMNSGISGTLTTDESFAALFNFWWLKYAFTHHLSDTFYSSIAVPYGIDIKIMKIVFPLWNAVNKWLTVFTNHIFAYNLETLFSFFASAFFMYYLTLNLTKNEASGIFSAVIYAFCPYHFARAWQHLGLAQIQWMPLYLLALLKLKDKPSFKQAILVSLAFFLVFSFDFYYAYFMLIVTVLFIFFILIYEWKIKLRQISYLEKDWNTLKMILIAGILVFLLTLPSIAGILKEGIKDAGYKKAPSAFNPYHRPFEDLFSQSARPLSYFLPATVHPIFGGFTEHFIGSPLYGMSFTEHTLYLGWIPLILAFVAFRKWRKIRKGEKGEFPSGTVPYREDFYIGFFIFLAIVAWLFSQPPWWKVGPIKIYMPSFFMYKILPMFRAYCRFGIVVMLSVAVLAGFGLKFILEKLKTQKTKIALTCLFSGFVLFEFWSWPPYKVIDVSKVPAVYYWLREQPGDFVIAEYPIDSESTNEVYKFYQTKHEKKIINGTIPGTYANKIAQTIRKLSQPETARVLKWMGVKYVLVHAGDYLSTELTDVIEELNNIPQNSDLKLIKSFPAQDCPEENIMCVRKTAQIDVYEVVAKPVEPKIEEK